MSLTGGVALAATLFSDNFDDGDASGWSKSGGDWTVVADGSSVFQQSNTDSSLARQFAGSSSWTNYTVSARVKPTGFNGSGSYAALGARSTGSSTRYQVALLNSGRAELQVVNGSTVTVVGGTNLTVSMGTWYTLQVTVSGSTLTGWVNGQQVASGSSSQFSTGRIVLVTSYAAARFDDVVVSDAAGPAPTSAAPSASRSSAPSPSPSGPAPSSSPGTIPTWPTKSGDAGLPNGTISVSGTFDGGMKRYCCIGDGGQSESQDPMFELANGATIKNVILGSPAGDGIHCLGTCTIQNVWWEDVGEDAATFLGTGGGTSYVIGGGAKSASDKVFQHNGNGTVNISGFYVENAGKLYRACGNCTNSYQRNVVIDNVITKSTSVVAGININWGDTARFTRITAYGSSTVICDKFLGAPKGSEPTHVGSGADGVNCFYSPSDITYR
ncbi:pectate lyase [Catellatospora sp. NEAU-YM18]|nr:pectate lyase [Catellatospora tritici]